MKTAKWRQRGYVGVAVLAVVLGSGSVGCAQDMAGKPAGVKVAEKQKGKTGDMLLGCPVFKYGRPIPRVYTGDGADVSPPLEWAQVPRSAKSLVLVCEDPDAPRGTWIHWVVVNIPVTASRIAEGGPLPAGAKEIKNSFGFTRYGGPCPPSGKHRYFFRLYALDLDALSVLTWRDCEKLLKQHAVAEAELMGTYRRP